MDAAPKSADHAVVAAKGQNATSLALHLFRFLVASRTVRELLFCAKHLFADANADAARLEQCDLRLRCGRKRLSAVGNKPGQEPGGEPAQVARCIPSSASSSGCRLSRSVGIWYRTR
jgi:hypothetical protein